MMYIAILFNCNYIQSSPFSHRTYVKFYGQTTFTLICENCPVELVKTFSCVLQFVRYIGNQRIFEDLVDNEVDKLGCGV